MCAWVASLKQLTILMTVMTAPLAHPPRTTLGHRMGLQPVCLAARFSIVRKAQCAILTPNGMLTATAPSGQPDLAMDIGTPPLYTRWTIAVAASQRGNHG